MSEWKELVLGDAPLEIIDGDRGKNYPKKTDFQNSGYCLFLNAKNVTSTGFAFSELNFIDKHRDKLLRKGKLKRGDVVLTTRGTVGNVAYYDEKIPFDHIRINSGMVIIRSSGIDKRYNYYLFKSLGRSFQVFATGSAQPQLPIRDLRQIPINLPPLPEQRAIAGVLSALDDKIDLLYRQNETLEALAQTLFRQWFIEEAEDDWEEGVLGDISENIRDSISHDKIPNGTIYIGLEHVRRKNIALDSHGFSDNIKSNKYQFVEDDILFGKLRPYFHKVCFAPFPGVCSTDILVIRPKQINYFNFCLFAYFQKDVVDFANLGSSGTRMPRTNWDFLKKYPIRIPDNQSLLKFNDLSRPLIQKIKKNLFQIRTLENLRDTLLPKLMSGEVQVRIE